MYFSNVETLPSLMPPWLDVDAFAPPGGATSGAPSLIPFKALPFIFTGHLFVENTTWKLDVFRNIFWRDPVVRHQLEARLEQRWRGKLCTRVEVAFTL